jgi:hypothetical protein
MDDPITKESGNATRVNLQDVSMKQIAENDMKDNSNKSLEWIKFDTDTLPSNLQDLLGTYRELEAKAASAKRDFTEAFEEAANAAGLGAAAGMEMIISLRFNDVSLAYKEKGSTKSATPRVGFNTTTIRPTATRGKNRVLK